MASIKKHLIIKTESKIHDTLFPEDFPSRADKIHYYPEIGSTMDRARELARKGCPSFTVVIADHQTKGRGRLTRTWISETGGLYFTLILRPDLPPSDAHLLNFACSLALAKTIRYMYNIPAGVKWPNDILVSRKKLAGMLSEMGLAKDRLDYVNIGIGINANNPPPVINIDTGIRAISLKQLAGHPIERKELLSAFLDRIETLTARFDPEAVIREWKQYSVTLNTHVRIVTNNEITNGFAVDVDDTGALLLKQENGTLKKIIYGDCFPLLS